MTELSAHGTFDPLHAPLWRKVLSVRVLLLCLAGLSLSFFFIEWLTHFLNWDFLLFHARSPNFHVSSPVLIFIQVQNWKSQSSWRQGSFLSRCFRF